MKRWLCPSALLLVSGCFDPPDVAESLTAGLMPVTTVDPTDGATDDATDGATAGSTAGSADGPSSGDTTPVPITCGDGVVDAGEACDDAGESATCNADCTTSACGDGVPNAAAGEACDDAGESAACNTDCTATACGDGVVNVTAGEACDTAGESAACNADCTASACGDGVLNVTAGEACDEGGSTAGCDADCTAVVCGDGVLNPASGEACDTAGESAACDADCSAASCGDGTVNATAGEECEAPTEFCGAGCLFAGCQPDPVGLALAACQAAYPNCDIVDGGVVGWDGGFCTGCNCGVPTDPWRFYCTVTAANNYNCSACTVGEILGPHDPCNCDPGTSPVLGTFCMQ